MREFSLAVILRAVDRGASKTIGRVGARLSALRANFAGVGAGVRQMGRGLHGLALAGAPVALGFAAMVKKGAEFEQAIARLRSKLLTNYDPALQSFAKTLGATTVFSATQAAEAMTNLAQAGFKSAEIIDATRGVLNAAAAEGIDLATASDIVAANVRSFGLEAKEAAKVAGILALASTKANTDMVQLQEGLKLASTSAKLVGADLADVTAVMGSLADIGLKGTLSGTAFRSAIMKLTAPTKAGKNALKELGTSVENVSKFLDKGDVVGAFGDVVGKLLKVEKTSKRAGLAMKIFGLRGVGIASALAKTDKTAEDFANTLSLLRSETGKTAEKMAAIQLDTLIGQFRLLASAVEGFSIEFFGLFGRDATGKVLGFGSAIQNLVLAMRTLAGEDIVDPKAKEQLAGVGETTFEVARGIREAVSELKETFRGVFEAVQSVSKALGFGDGAKGVAKLMTKFVLLTAVLAPLALALGGVVRLVGAFGSIGIGAARTVAGGVGGLLRTIGGKTGGRFGRLLGGLGGAAAKATAQPVRVVNFDELGGLGGLGGGALGGGPLGAVEKAEATKRLGLFARSRAAFGRFVSRFGRTGAFLTQNVGALGRGFGGVTRGLLARGGLIAAAGAAGFALGTFIDKTFGLSEKISNFFLGEKFKKQRELPQPGSEVFRKSAEVQAKAMAERLAKLSEAGVKKVGIGVGGAEGREALTREAVERRTLAFLSRLKVADGERKLILTRLQSTLARIPRAEAAKAEPVKVAKDAAVSKGGLLPVSRGDLVVDREALASGLLSNVRGGLVGRTLSASPAAAPAAPMALTIEVPVMIDGREVAVAVAEHQLDDLERSGGALAPGERSSMLQRGTRGAFR